MRPIEISTFILMLVASASYAFANDKKLVLSVETMVCGPDPHNVKSALSLIKGVKDVQISLAEKQVTVTFDEQLSNPDHLLSEMAGAGYAALIVGGPR